MLRTRKKDFNLKPNRILDKRSSRGMLYDNEELRLRTIHINDEVDKGQNDIKKLKKENENLKREIWSLRDEYEKLEEVLKRVYAAHRDGLPLESPETLMQEFPPQRLRLNSRGNYRRGSGISGMTFGGESSMSMYESEEEELEDLLMIDEDGSQVSVYHSQAQALESPDGEGPSTRCHLALPESEDSPNLGVSDRLGVALQESPPRPHHHWQHLTSVTPDLEVVREESEHTNSNSNNSPMPARSPYEDETCGHPDLANLHNPGASSDLDSAPSFNPIKIEITTPEPPQTSTNETLVPDSANFQDLGCITLVPEKYSVRTEMRLGCDDGQAEGSEAEAHATVSRANSNPEQVADSSPDLKLNKGRRKSIFGGLVHRPVPNSSNRVRSQTLSYPAPNTVLVQSQPSDFPSFYQSEPSLSSRRESLCFPNPPSRAPEPETQPPLFRQPPLDWSSVDRNVVIGTIEKGSNGVSGKANTNYKLSDLRAQEIIDELEAQFDSTLEEVAGVRMMGTGPIRIFISLRRPEGVEELLRRGLRLRGGQVVVRLVEASRKCSVLVLSGLPPHLPDSTVITVLNQFGQVVAPLEKRIYKGVDIAERLARMHLVTKVPTIVNIAGYEVPAKICHCQAPNPGDTPPALPVTSLSLEHLPGGGRQVTNGGENTGCLPCSASSTTRTNPSSIQPPPLGQGKGHQPITRAISSAPRLESDAPANTGQPATRRQMSVSGAPPPAAPNAKKPLSRLLRSSPGSLVPPPMPEVPGPAKSFYRSMSFDPRRGSNASTNRFHTLTIVGSESANPHPGLEGNGNRALQSQTSHHSQLVRRETSSLGSGMRKLEPGKNLPWCGCWGNGCI